MINHHQGIYRTLLGLRCYVTAAENHHARLGLPSWPSYENPSPKDIFNISSVTPNFEKEIKATYQKYVKLYHPDVKIDIIENGSTISFEEKRKRFDQISSAYEILKNPSKRHIYFRFGNSCYNNTRYTPEKSFKSEQSASFDRFRADQRKYRPHAYNPNDPFWHAATWEDYYRLKYKRKVPTAEEQQKNKYKILALVVTIMILSAVLQYLLAVRKAREYKNKQQDLSQPNSIAVSESTSRNDRLHRFLVSRRFNYYDSGDIVKHESMKEEEKRIMKTLS